MMFQNTALYVPVNSTKRDLYNGTLEYVYSGPNSRFAYLLGSTVADSIVRLIYVIPMILVFFIYTRVTVNVVGVLAVMVIFVITVAFIGVLISLTAIMWKQVNNFIAILGILLQFVGGAFLPIQTFPVYVQWIAFLLPFTYAYDLVRYYAFGGNYQTILPLELEWLLLFVNLFLYYFLAKVMLKKVEYYAKNNGLHII
jgi:ABC-2 type transport system permease protein